MYDFYCYNLNRVTELYDAVLIATMVSYFGLKMVNISRHFFYIFCNWTHTNVYISAHRVLGSIRQIFSAYSRGDFILRASWALCIWFASLSIRGSFSFISNLVINVNRRRHYYFVHRMLQNNGYKFFSVYQTRSNWFT